MSLRTKAPRSGSVRASQSPCRGAAASFTFDDAPLDVLDRGLEFAAEEFGVHGLISASPCDRDRLSIADPVQPARKRSVPPIGVQTLHDLDERLLDGVLGKMAVSEDAIRERVHAIGELAEQRRRRRGLSNRGTRRIHWVDDRAVHRRPWRQLGLHPWHDPRCPVHVRVVVAVRRTVDTSTRTNSTCCANRAAVSSTDSDTALQAEQ